MTETRNERCSARCEREREREREREKGRLLQQCFSKLSIIIIRMSNVMNEAYKYSAIVCVAREERERLLSHKIQWLYELIIHILAVKKDPWQ